MSRDVQIADAEVDQVNECFHTSESTGSVFDHSNDAIQPFGYGIGDSTLDKGDDVFGVLSERGHELAEWLQPALEGRGAPTFQESPCGPRGLEVPELLELILQNASPMNPAITLAEALQDTPIFAGSVRIISEENPPNAFEHLPFLPTDVTPLLLADFVHRRVERFHEMKPVQDELGVWTMLFESADEGFTHVAAGPLDLFSLVRAEEGVEELIDRCAALSLADPKHATPLEIVDDGHVFVSLSVRDFIDSNTPKPPDSVPVANAVNRPVKDVRERRLRDVQELGSRFLGHQLRIRQHEEFQSVADASVGIGPGNVLLGSAVSRAHDFLRGVNEEDRPSTDRDIPPGSGLWQDPLDLASASAFGTPAPIFVRFHCEIDRLLSGSERDVGNFESFQFEQLGHRLRVSHPYRPFLFGFVVCPAGTGRYG